MRKVLKIKPSADLFLLASSNNCWAFFSHRLAFRIVVLHRAHSFSFFLGGVKHAEMLTKNDNELCEIVTKALPTMLRFPHDIHPEMIRIFRHERAIPQYELSSGERFAAITRIEQNY